MILRTRLQLAHAEKPFLKSFPGVNAVVLLLCWVVRSYFSWWGGLKLQTQVTSVFKVVTLLWKQDSSCIFKCIFYVSVVGKKPLCLIQKRIHCGLSKGLLLSAKHCAVQFSQRGLSMKDWGPLLYLTKSRCINFWCFLLLCIIYYVCFISA